MTPTQPIKRLDYKAVLMRPLRPWHDGSLELDCFSLTCSDTQSANWQAFSIPFAVLTLAYPSFFAGQRGLLRSRWVYENCRGAFLFPCRLFSLERATAKGR